ncbi:MAG: NAD-dependent epimerase/dehydratase family protein [Candidatus Aenigmarchaeota archaeon]|nr:NAD-dependent epimerase/dehydratase family protein [Candidatus Aenigmarchaeota archaeon]
MKVLVTGGAGFIGSHTVDLLVERGHDVRILDNFENQVHGGSRPTYINGTAELTSGDILDKKTWVKALTGVEAVIHLAAMVGMGQSMYQPVRYMMANSIGTANMYEAIIENPEIKNNLKKIVSASSKSIYGEGSYRCGQHGVINPVNRPVDQLARGQWEVLCPHCGNEMAPVGITEDKPPQNLAAYALSKYDTERLTLMFGDTLKIPSITFRYFNVYGPRQSLGNPYTGVAAIFLSRVKNDNPPVIYEDGKMVRDFIFVEDVAMGNVLALEKGRETDVFNLGTGKSVTIEQIARTLIELNGREIEPKITNEFRPGDSRHDFADIGRAEKKLGFKPKWSLKSGMEKLVEWSDDQKAVDKFDQAEKERIRYLGG